MNRTYRTFFNRALGAWQVVGETARRRGKASRGCGSALLAGSAAVALLVAPPAWATATFDETDDAGPGTFRDAVDTANADSSIATVYSELAAGSEVALTGGAVAISTDLTLGGAAPFTLYSDDSNVLELSGSGRTLTLGDQVTVLSTRNESFGILAEGGGNTINVLGLIETEGRGGSHAIYAQGGNNTIEVPGEIETRGGGSAIRAEGGGNTIDVSGRVFALGVRTTVAAYDGNNTINVSGEVLAPGGQGTHLNDAHRAISVSGGNNTINVSGTVKAAGAREPSRGIQVRDDDNTVDVSGSVESVNSAGIYVSGEGNTVTVTTSGRVESVNAEGIGVWGEDNTVIVSGRVASSSDEGVAISLRGSQGSRYNRLELHDGYEIVGDVVANDASFHEGFNNTLALGGDGHGSFDVGEIGDLDSEVKYQGFDRFETLGESTWTLTGSITETTPWTLTGGTLSVSSDGQLGATSGSLTFDGGTLRVTGTDFASTDRNIVWGNDGGGFDIAEAGHTFTLYQEIDGDGGLTKRGAGTLQAGHANAFVDDTAYTVDGGILDLNGNDLTMSSLRGGKDGEITLGSARLTIDQDANTEYAGDITSDVDNSGFIKRGDGTLTLMGEVDLHGNAATIVDGGELRIADGGGVSSQGGMIGSATNTNTNGAVTVKGNGSQWNSGSYLDVGYSGSGELNIEAGGTVSNASFGIIGHESEGEGTLTVTGTGSRWDNGWDIEVGRHGRGTLTIADGGEVAVDRGGNGVGGVTIANHDGSTGTLNIGTAAGEGATAPGVLETDTLTFGDGSGRLVFNHDDTDGHDFDADLLSGGDGTHTIDHHAGTTILSGDNEGFSGDTTLSGGTLRAGQTNAFADDTAYILDGGTLDLNGHDLTMSSLSGGGGLVSLGSANLTIDQGGVTEYAGDISGGGSLIHQGDGTLTLMGEIEFNGNVTVADGELRIAEGGSVTNDEATIADGKVTVTGEGSRWTNNGFQFYVGREGSGELTIADGGHVSSPVFSYIGMAGGTGTVTVTGTGSTWAGNEFEVGGHGIGELTIADGGAVTGKHMGIGADGTLNIGAAADEGATAPGVLETDTLTFGSGDGNLVFNHTADDYGFEADLASESGADGNHTIDHHAGTTTLSGDSQGFIGTATVSGGTLIVENTLGGSVGVESGGTLGGSGSVGDTTVADGGTLAPGNSIGTLTVDGDLALSSGSILAYELGVPGSSDRIDVTGDLTLDGTLDLAQSGDEDDGEVGLGYYRLMTFGTLNDDSDDLAIGKTPDLTGVGAYQVHTGNGYVDLFIAALGDDDMQHWQGGDGLWNDDQWRNQNGDIDVAWAGNTAIFEDAGGHQGGTITVIDMETLFQGLQFRDEGYTLVSGIDGALQTADDGSEIRVLADSAEIAARIHGDGGITKTEAGTLILSGHNRYTGGTVVQAGTLQASHENAFVDETAYTVDGGTLDLNGHDLVMSSLRGGDDGEIALGSARLTIDQDVDTAYAGDISGGGSLIHQGGGTLTLMGEIELGGDVTVDDGELRIADGGRVTNDEATIADGKVTVTGEGSEWINEGSQFTVGREGSGELTIADGGHVSSPVFSYIGMAGGTGTVTVTGTGSTWAGNELGVGRTGTGELTIADGGAVTGKYMGIGADGTLNIGAGTGEDATAPGVLDVDTVYFGDGMSRLVFNHSDTDGDYTFAPRLSNDDIIDHQAGTIDHQAGTTTLNGDNSGFSGETTVSGGILVVDTTLGGTVTVNAGGTLGGGGTVGRTTVTDGGTLAPGSRNGSGGTLTVAGDLTLSSGSILAYELGVPGSDSDPGTSGHIDVEDDLTLDGTLMLSDAGEAGPGYYRLMTYGGSLFDHGLAVDDTRWDDYDILTGSDGVIDLFITAVGDDEVQHWQGGDGTWRADGETWLNRGGNLPATWAGHHAAFKHEPGGFDGGEISVEGTQHFKSLQFVDEGYRLEGPGVLHTSGDGSEIRVLADSAEIATEITGSGGITKTEAGTLILSGDNSYQGGTTVLAGILQAGHENAFVDETAYTVDGGTLDLNDHDLVMSSLSGDGGELALGNATLTVDQQTDTRYAGTISGDGKLRFSGGGSVELTGDSSGYAGTTAVDGTTLTVNDHFGGSLAVGNDGRLQGDGTVGATTLANDATIAPGNSIGELTVDGDLTFDAGSSYEVEVDPTGSDSDHIHVTGTAYLDGSVAHIGESGDYDPESTYRILSAEGGLDGEFDDVSSTFAFLDAALEYDTESSLHGVDLTLTRN
ncbi:autotransporter-associated beta strand repeat-containing protein, partial [Billgrantia endophytica]